MANLAGGRTEFPKYSTMCVIFASKVKVMLPHLPCHTAGNVIIDP